MRSGTRLLMFGGRWTPAKIPTASRVVWRRSRLGVLYTDTAGTTAAVDTNTIALNVTAGDSPTSPALRYYSQATANSRPTFDAANKTLSFDGGDSLGYSSTANLTGDCDLWAVGNRAAGKNWCPFGGATTQAAQIFSDNAVYFTTSAEFGNALYTGSTGLILAHWYRRSGAWTFEGSGMAAAALGNGPSAIGLAFLATRGFGDFTAAGGKHAEELAIDGDGTAYRSRLLAYFAAEYGATL